MFHGNNPEWPPRSPHDVLLSTPSGRDRLRRLAERASPSPSPSKQPRSIRKPVMANPKLGMDLGASDEDDEETLQLKLQEIQARLRLKKLQKKSKQTSDTENDGPPAALVPPFTAASAAASRAQSRAVELGEDRLPRSKSQTNVHVPVSPVRRVKPEEVQRSPGRVLLGIDKGLKGKDISLKRAPSLRRQEERDQSGSRLAGPFLQRAGSRSGSCTPGLSAELQPSGKRQKSFSERLADVRVQETDREARELRIKKSRSTAFDIDHAQMESLKKTALDMPETLRPAPHFSREDVLRACGHPSERLAHSKTTPNLRSAMEDMKSSTSLRDNSSRLDSRASDGTRPSKSSTQPDSNESDTTQFEPYSSTHLSKRIIPHNELTRILTSKRTFTIPSLLRIVKSPDYSTPDIEEDLVLFGIVAQKSEPRAHQQQSANDNRGKYMVMTLTDLKWELELYLFGSAFDKFWKLTVGTIIAILNPGIMPPQRNKIDTGRFSLTLNSNADTVLEIGSARDLGFCKSVKKDGKTCSSWVDKRHTEFCDFHVNETLKKTHANRMEVNTMTFGKGTYTSSSSRGKSSSKAAADKEKEKAKLTRYDRESHSQIYMSRGTSTARLLDDVDFDPDSFHRGSSKEERLTRRILERERERELGKKLAEMGAGLGADYMRKREAGTNPSSTTMSTAQLTLPTAPTPAALSSLDLLTSKPTSIALSPIKRKRTNTVSSSSGGAIGWGGNLSKELNRMKNGESLLPPVKKKTRFVTERGIREAGRESLGGEVARQVVGGGSNELDEDDDDLDIIRD